MYGWGALYLKASGAKPTVRDVTLEKIGYQTDNGAFYCFCKPNCSNTVAPRDSTQFSKASYGDYGPEKLRKKHVQS